MIVHAGPVVHDTRLGRLHLHRRVNAAQLELIVRTIEHTGVDWRRVMSARIVEGAASLHTIDDEVAGRHHHRYGRTIVGRRRR